MFLCLCWSHIAAAEKVIVTQIDGVDVTELGQDIIGQTGHLVVGQVNVGLTGHELGGAGLPVLQLIGAEVEDDEPSQAAQQGRVQVLHGFVVVQVQILEVEQPLERRRIARAETQRAIVQEERAQFSQSAGKVGRKLPDGILTQIQENQLAQLIEASLMDLADVGLPHLEVVEPGHSAQALRSHHFQIDKVHIEPLEVGQISARVHPQRERVRDDAVLGRVLPDAQLLEQRRHGRRRQLFQIVAG